jgi:hypothetical protein
MEKAMLTIWKYTLEITDDDQEFNMPLGARIVYVANQYETFCLWAVVDPNAPTHKRYFRVHGTGHDVDPKLAYVGSIMIKGGALVFHAFEVPV